MQKRLNRLMAIGCLVKKKKKNQAVTKRGQRKGGRAREEILEITEAKIS